MKLAPVLALLLVCIIQQAQAGSFSSRRLLQVEDRAVLASVQALNNIDECTNTYLGLQLISDQTSQTLTELENGSIANKLDLKNLTELIAINSATLVRTSVNISELQMTLFTLTQDLLAFNSDLLGLENDVLQSQAQLDGLSNIVTVNGTGLILPVIGSVISANDTLTATAECPSGYRPLKVTCSIDGPLPAAFNEAGTGTVLTGTPSASIILQTVEGSTGTCSYQLYYINPAGAQVNIEFNTDSVIPVTATAQVLCRAV